MHIVSGIIVYRSVWSSLGLLCWLTGKESPANERNADLTPESGRSPKEGNGNPLHSCLGNPMDHGNPMVIPEEPVQSMGSQKNRT